ncbi:hypothetical protein R3P38DRAFT_2808860 [Favolaschia claudopus]|uniref:Uncharacterized protein n=1 Tax=Favolaschia claudopus TaxID=2862362 RepID=A0AAV9ZEZ4_9AGAR
MAALAVPAPRPAAQTVPSSIHTVSLPSSLITATFTSMKSSSTSALPSKLVSSLRLVSTVNLSAPLLGSTRELRAGAVTRSLLNHRATDGMMLRGIFHIVSSITDTGLLTQFLAVMHDKLHPAAIQIIVDRLNTIYVGDFGAIFV